MIMDYRHFKKSREIFITIFLIALVVLLVMLIVFRDRMTFAETYTIVEDKQMSADEESISDDAREFSD